MDYFNSKYRYQFSIENPIRNDKGLIIVNINGKDIGFEREAPFEFSNINKLSIEDIELMLSKTQQNIIYHEINETGEIKNIKLNLNKL